MSMAWLNSLKYGDSLVILGISVASAVLCEGISWLLIYRTSNYKTLRSSIDKTSKKLETLKTTVTKKSSKSKKVDRFESSLKESNRDLSLSKFKSGAVVGVVLIMVFGFLNSLFEGKVVAKLPFTPIPMVQKMSHRGLPGDDATDCAMVFLYFLCSMSVRSNLQKFLGFAPPRGSSPGLFPLPDPKTS